MSEDLSEIEYTEAGGIGIPGISYSISESPVNHPENSHRTIWSRTFTASSTQPTEYISRVATEPSSEPRRKHSSKRPHRSRKFRMQEIKDVSIVRSATPRCSLSKSAKLNKLPVISRASLMSSLADSYCDSSVISSIETSTDTKEHSQDADFKEITEIDLSTRLLSERKYQLSLLRKRIEKLDDKERLIHRGEGYANFLSWIGSFIGCGER